MEDGLELEALLQVEDHLGVVAAVAREEDAPVYHEAVARERLGPGRARVGYVLGPEEIEVERPLVDGGELAVRSPMPLGPELLEEVLEAEGFAVVDFVECSASAK